MEHDWVLYIAAFSTAFAISNVITPVAKKISIKAGAIDYPKARGMHSNPMPRMGGIAIVLGFMLTLMLLYRFTSHNDPRQIVGFLIGAGCCGVFRHTNKRCVLAIFNGFALFEHSNNNFVDCWSHKCCQSH